MSVQNEIDRIAQNVANTYAALEALGADMPEEQTSDNLSATAGTAKVVLYKEQTLTDEQKAQARNNIGIVGTGIDGKDGLNGKDGVDGKNGNGIKTIEIVEVTNNG